MSQHRQAVKLFTSFRERKPRKVGNASFVVPKAVACMGYVEGIDYRTTHGKKVTLYHHDFAPGSRPLLAVSSDGKQLLLLGGRYQFTERGIVDHDAAGREVENAKHGKTINPRFSVTRLPDGGDLRISRKRRSTGAVAWSVTRYDKAGKKMGRTEFFPSEASARRIAAEVLEGLGGAKVGNPRGGLRQKDVFAELRKIGVSAKKTGEGNEIRVTLAHLPKDRQEAVAYYTDDLQDALNTGKAMMRSQVSNPRANAEEIIRRHYKIAGKMSAADVAEEIADLKRRARMGILTARHRLLYDALDLDGSDAAGAYAASLF